MPVRSNQGTLKAHDDDDSRQQIYPFPDHTWPRRRRQPQSEVSADYEADVLSFLDEHRISHSTAIELSAGPSEWIEVLQVLGAAIGGGSLLAVAQVIKAFGHRHDGKRFVVKIDGLESNADGRSVKEIEQLIQQLPSTHDELDAETRRSLGQSLDPE